MGSNHPDSQLYPHATGAAAKMVSEHSSEQSLKLYSGWFCPFVQRVLLVLLEKSIPFQYIEVNPYLKPASLLSLNPRGLVPTLQYANKPLYESTVICEFLEEAYPSSSPKLLPQDPYERAYGRIWSDFVTSRIIPAFHRALQYQVTGEGNSEAGFGEVKGEFVSKIREFTEAMSSSSGPFFFGEEISMVDLILAPWAVRLWVFEHFKGGLELGGEKWTERWGAWLKAVEERESVKATTSEREHYLPIYQRYADDTAQSELAKATRKGRGVP
ncbi:glutathione transferase omega-1 [Mollisia scopiformis]|uniref:Glutathione transferase omega-1 n=1 Tax=Mollisia scopiformis TaxID=149040 RepID=A0A132B871_MOLSC|nr:glutathione transferase omega-1 [Mollisia scopiformis]KUJ08606.1 glutathione transferase omega-1 [Mollisia scopiformis]